MAETKVAPIASRLRASILQQAVQGKLVPQDPSEGTADELLEHIREERAELVKQKKAKAPKGGESGIWRGDDGSWYEQRGKGEPDCIDDEIPFDIPETWAWSRLNDLCNFGACENIEYQDVPVGTWNFDLEDLEKNTGRILRKKYKRENETGSTKHVFRTGMVLYSKLRPYLNKVTVADEDGVCTSEILPLHFDALTSYFAMRFFMTPYFLELANTHISGIKMPRLRVNEAKKFLIPIPPIAEQERIVARIDELMPLVDQLEIRERESDAVDAAFWKALPQSILQEAVQGRLVSQDDDDEPADALLERIREERRELVKQKKAKAPKGGESRIYQGANGSWYEQRDKGEPVCVDDEIPFDIPESWGWARMSTIALVLNGDRGKNYPAKSKLHHEGIPFVGALNITNRKVVSDQMLYMDDNQYAALGAGKLQKDDFVFCIRGSLGKYGLFPFDAGAIASSLVIVRTLADSEIFRSYVDLLLGSPCTAHEIRRYNNGTAQPNLSAANFEKFLYPVPPLAEQARIISKVNSIASIVSSRDE